MYSPHIPHIYVARLGYAGICLLFLLQNIDCGYSLELPRGGGSNVYPYLCFECKFGKYKKNYAENFHFFRTFNISVYRMMYFMGMLCYEKLKS